MNLVYLTALVAVCGAAKLDRTYLPPSSAETAGGSSGDIQAPYERDSFSPGRGNLPKDAFDNDFEGVVVEALAPGSRYSGPFETGLGAARISYGSTHSKVGEAAFQEFQTQTTHGDQIESQTSQNFHHGTQPDFHRVSLRPQSGLDSASSIVRFQSEVGPDAYNYAYETDNGITAEENGIDVNGIQSEGGFSYTGDDGKLYKVSYTAGKGGYRPVGDHLPTPPPIPDEILKSLEQNAKDEAAGLVDDGSYDAAKYNTGDDYIKSDRSNGKYNVGSAFAKTSHSDADASGTFINQNSQAFGGPNTNGQITSSHTTSNNLMVGNNVFGSFPSNDRPTQSAIGPGNRQSSVDEYFENVYSTHSSGLETPKFEPLSPQNTPKENYSSLTQIGLSKSDRKTISNKGSHVDDISSVDDYSRPIHFGTQISQAFNSGFGLKQSYLPPINNVAHKQFLGYKSDDNAQSGKLSLNNTQRHIENQFQTSSSFQSYNTDSNLDQKVVGLQSIPQTSPFNNLNQYSQSYNQAQSGQNQDQFANSFSNIAHLNSNSGVKYHEPPHFNSNTFNNPHPTLQPQRDLTTPFEDFPNKDTFESQEYTDNQKPNQLTLSVPTQASFSTLSTSNFQSHNVNYNNEGNIPFNPSKSQQTGNGVALSQYQGPDHSYYYNQPSKPFSSSNQYNRVTPPTLIFGNSHFTDNNKSSMTQPNVHFQDSTKYPRPPTVAPVVSTLFIKNNNNQYPDASLDTSYASQTESFIGSTKYPKPPMVGNFVQSPTTPIMQNGGQFQSHYTGITQASIYPFPSISLMTYPTPNSNKMENFGFKQNFSQSSLSNPSIAMQQETQSKPSQQYDGEIYEYKKPVETLPTPKSDEDSTPNTEDSFAQFGQKLRPTSFIQTSTSQNAQREKQNDFKIDSERIDQESQSQLGSPNLRPQFNQNKVTQESQSNSEVLNQRFNSNNGLMQAKPSDNLLTIGTAQSTQSTKFTPGAFPEKQHTTDSKVTFGFSSRIRPCCQGSRISSSSSQKEQSESNLSKYEPQNTNLRPNFDKEGLSNQSTGFQGQKGLQSTQSTSQLSQGEEFGGPRRPPSFDEASGYHY